MNKHGISPLMLGFPLIILLVAGCASPLVSPVPTALSPTPIDSLLPPSTTPTSLPSIATPTPVPPTSTSTTSPPTPTRTPLPPPISPDFPTGTFAHRHEGGAYCVFQFNSNGTYAYYWMVSTLDLSKIKPVEQGTFSIDSTLYTITSTDWTACPAPVTYNWTYDGQTLTFQLVGHDSCSDRQKTYESPLLYKRLK